MSEIEGVQQIAHVVTVSQQTLADTAAFRQAWMAWDAMSPAERQAALDEAAAARAHEREQTPRVDLTVIALADALGLTPEQARHLVQSYCTCDVGPDGWERCQHWRDEGLDR